MGKFLNNYIDIKCNKIITVTFILQNKITKTFTKDTLKSNLFLDNLYDEENVIKVKENALKHSEGFKYCRYINYYIVLMNTIIKSANGFYKDIWDNLIKKVEQKWEQFPEVNYKDELSDDDITIPRDMESLIMTISLEKISPNKIQKA
ncbi:hypothetical protein POVCU2_0079640 [Plasmodium ovale curtisi]|uniref:PIR Superfamily Protein n=1 Tax=Plasmodium ovale curtisi TaxID=864141 RepID=A0A1A8WJU2_PLAOA|nr:hypothetical protein POVCU2_0079640 [Plasmodium ovale curtisi]